MTKPTMTFFAVQLCRCETTQDVAELVLRKASELKASCKTLEVLEVMDLGAWKYVRMQSDMDPLTSVVSSLHTPTRGVVVPEGTAGYVHHVGSRKAVVPFSRMSVIARNPPVVYRGVDVPHWERQFMNAGE